jgi:hypothetical protein
VNFLKLFLLFNYSHKMSTSSMVSECKFVGFALVFQL